MLLFELNGYIFVLVKGNIILKIKKSCMNTYYKNNLHIRYNIKNVGFFSGFLYFFGLTENPYTKAINQIKRRSDVEALKSDWNVIGKDFQKVIIKKKPILNACK